MLLVGCEELLQAATYHAEEGRKLGRQIRLHLAVMGARGQGGSRQDATELELKGAGSWSKGDGLMCAMKHGMVGVGS